MKDPFQLEADNPYRFEIVFYDQHQRRKWWVTQPPVANEDVNYFIDWLDELLPDEMREHVITFAKLIVGAHERMEGTEKCTIQSGLMAEITQ